MTPLPSFTIVVIVGEEAPDPEGDQREALGEQPPVLGAAVNGVFPPGSPEPGPEVTAVDMAPVPGYDGPSCPFQRTFDDLWTVPVPEWPAPTHQWGCGRYYTWQQLNAVETLYAATATAAVAW